MVIEKDVGNQLEREISLFEVHLNEWQTLLRTQKQARNQLRIKNQKKKMMMSLRELTCVENWTNLVHQHACALLDLQELQEADRRRLKARQHQERMLFN